VARPFAFSRTRILILHAIKDLKCRSAIDFWKTQTRQAREEYRRWSSSIAMRADGAGEPNEVQPMLFSMWHIDGETARGLPNVRRETTAESHTGFYVRNIGFYAYASGRMSNFLLDYGMSKEDTNLLCDLILLNALKEPSRENITILVFDRFAANVSSILPAFLTFVTDELRLWAGCGILYFAPCHGKGPADSAFGQHKKIASECTLFSSDQYGYEILSRVNQSNGPGKENG